VDTSRAATAYQGINISPRGRLGHVEDLLNVVAPHRAGGLQQAERMPQPNSGQGCSICGQ
jgi:hypothetical protein